MWALLELVVEPVIEVFSRIYRADERPDARRFTVGCLLLLLALIGLTAGLIYFLGRRGG